MSIGSSLIKIGSAIAAVGLLAGGIAVLGTWYKHARETDQVPDEQKIARTLEIIRTSTPTDHKALKVLFYGQSITASGWKAVCWIIGTRNIRTPYSWSRTGHWVASPPTH